MNRRNRKKEMTREKLTCDNTNTQSNDLLQRPLYTKTQPLSLYVSKRKKKQKKEKK